MHITEKSFNSSWAGARVLHFDTIDSTNEEAKRIYNKVMAEGRYEGCDLGIDASNRLAKPVVAAELNGLLLMADEQTAGKGRHGREWKSPKGGSIAYSILIVPENLPIDAAPMMTPIMAMVASEVLNEYYGIDTKIKWPNDIVLEDKKLSGTLTEMSIREGKIEYIIVGTGINIGEAKAEKLNDIAVTIEESVPAEDTLAEIIKRFGEAVDEFYKTKDLSGVRARYERLLVNLNREVRVLDPKGEFTGVSQGIDDCGKLKVKVSDGSVRLIDSGEVSVRGIYGYTI